MSLLLSLLPFVVARRRSSRTGHGLGNPFAFLFLFVFSIPVCASPPPRTALKDVPSWARQAIWYQIFPERFRNGDTRNDPTVSDIRGAWPHEEPGEWQVSRWTSDWYGLQTWEAGGEKGFYYRAQQRRYGGDLQGVIDKLDYLKDLGITAIYLNPVFESPSLHKYDATMYHHIDNNFGPDPDGDRRTWARENPADPATWQWTSADRLFLELIKEAHKREMRIVIDGVFNHAGMTFWAFEDVRQNGEKSAYKDWFVVNKFDDPSTPENEFDYHGWYDVKELPEIREVGDDLAPGPKQHLHAIVKRWMDPNADGNPSDGIDGWRLDVADMVPLGFWRDFRTWVRGINPEAYIVGEVWWEDYGNKKMFNAEKWLRGDAFDAVMNYRWAREVFHFFNDKRQKSSTSEFDKRLAALRNDYRSEVNYVLQNLLDSHDTDRLSSHVINVDADYDRNVGVNDNRDFLVRRPRADEIRTLKLMVLFQMTYPGAPMIYYGDEAGMWGADDPDCRKPMVWPEMKFENESHHPFNSPRPDDVNGFDGQLHAYYKKTIALRRDHPSLSVGSLTTIIADDTHDVYGFLRSYKVESLLVLFNNSAVEREVTIPVAALPKAKKWISLLEAGTTTVASGVLKTRLAAKAGAVLRAEPR